MEEVELYEAPLVPQGSYAGRDKDLLRTLRHGLKIHYNKQSLQACRDDTKWLSETASSTETM